MLSQDGHARFGGVVPEIAARAHLAHLPGLVTQVLRDAGLAPGDLGGVAATSGPGLIGGLIVGSGLGKGIALAAGLPFVAVNHLEAHALTARLTDGLAFPYLLLLVSGGHCQCVAVESVGRYRRLGGTIDDAVGEAFDKVGKLLGLPWPGGPALERLAAGGSGARYPLPRPLRGRPGCDFSFSGLKTAVAQLVAGFPPGPLPAAEAADIAASFQQAVADVMADRAAHALAMMPGVPLVVAGGVAANALLRVTLARVAEASGVALVAPPLRLCGDNAVMVAWAGIERLRLGLSRPAGHRAPPALAAGRDGRMNYRHAFHAGNFADCMKHAVLVWLLRALARKPAAFAVLDTHAGAGWYALDDGPAQRTGEWRAGIARLLDDPPAPLVDYVGLVKAKGFAPGPHWGRRPQTPLDFGTSDGTDEAENARFPKADRPLVGFGATPQSCRESTSIDPYPGSPALIRALLRPDDRLICCETHPEAAAALRRLFARDAQVSVHARDGWSALGALLPPAQKRGLVLIDPPYEQGGEHARLAAALATVAERFPAAIVAGWYPIKHLAPVRALHETIRLRGPRDTVAAELWLRDPTDPARLNGCGLLVRHPPWHWDDAWPPLLAALLDRLGNGEPGAGTRTVRLTDE